MRRITHEDHEPETTALRHLHPKSTEHNLDLAFNSLDAQREPCEAYVRSHAHEGWRLVPDRYGGLSGASFDRPALQLLLSDVRAGRVDVIVVYKVDRLTRRSPTSPSSLSCSTRMTCRSCR